MGIKEIMEAVLKTLDSNNERQLIYHDGSIYRSTSIVNPPAEEAATAQFERQIGYELPKDYRSFLLEYNGVWVYQIITELGGNGGGGLKMFSIQELKEHLHYMEDYPHFLPIGSADQQFLAISLEAIDNKNPNYLYRLDTVEGPQALNLNLHLFLTRFVVAQGAPFWEWPNYSADSHFYSDNE